MDARDMHVARLQFDDEEDEVAPETAERQHLDCEQVGGREPLPVCLQKRRPARTPTALRCGVDPLLLEDPLDRIPGDLVPEVVERSSNSGVAPAWVVTSHQENELLDVGFGPRTT